MVKGKIGVDCDMTLKPTFRTFLKKEIINSTRIKQRLSH